MPDTVMFCGEIKAILDKAILVFDGENEVWLPKSQIKNYKSIRSDDYEFEISRYIALKKGII